MTGLIDTHAHLQFPEFDGDRQEVLERAWQAGLEAIVVVGTSLADSQLAQALAHREPGLYATAGVHPHEARGFGKGGVGGPRPQAQHPDIRRVREEGTLQALRDLASSPKVVALGEIGLDFYRTLSPRQDQFQAFQEQLALARELRLPVVVHARSADEETFAILAAWAAEAEAAYQGRPLGVMHCFAGDLELAQRYHELGFLISIPCTVTYRNNERLDRIAAALPLESLVVETDSPYLPPQSRRGRRNEPAYVSEAVTQLAQLRGLDEATVAARTAENARRLFRLEL